MVDTHINNITILIIISLLTFSSVKLPVQKLSVPAALPQSDTDVWTSCRTCSSEVEE